jgi:hypothetical protein
VILRGIAYILGVGLIFGLSLVLLSLSTVEGAPRCSEPLIKCDGSFSGASSSQSSSGGSSGGSSSGGSGSSDDGKSNAGRGNGSEPDANGNDRDPGKSGDHNNGRD